MSEMLIRYDKKVYDTTSFASIIIGGVPIVGSILSGTLNFANEKLIQKRIGILLDKLNNSDLNMNDEIIKNDDFIHGTSIIVNAVSRTNSEEKIKMLSEFIVEGIRSEEMINDISGFEYFVELMQTVSFTELKMLEIIHSIDGNLELDNKGRNNTAQLNEFILNEIQKYIKYNEDLIFGILDKLSYTGLLNKVQVNSFVYGATTTSYFYKVSSLYNELRKRISINLEII